jgi:hypothetical protein
MREVEFRKSSFSGGQNGSCVEIAHAVTSFGIRDSKNASGPMLLLDESQGAAFLTAVKQSR